ncbi:hypothetical protein CBL_00130 [Carabus blaptoides fortunei]
MRTAVIFVICIVGLAAAAYLPPLDPLTCQDPANVSSPNCNFIPPGCLWPICATDGMSAPRWFKSGCHMNSYNQQCRRRFRGTYEGLCPIEDRPEQSPLPCPNSQF